MEYIPLCKILTTEVNFSLNKRVVSKASVAVFSDSSRNKKK